MYPVSCTYTYHGITDFVNHGIVKIQKFKYLENVSQLLYEIKKFLTCASDDTV